MRVAVVIPAYNEERTIGEVVRNVREQISDVVVVDDGSHDGTAERARHAGARVITHCINRGLGAALGTGLAAALQAPFFSPSRREGEREGEGKQPDIIVTLDADGQHDPADIPALIAPIQAGLADLVIGVRWQIGRSPSLRVREGWGGLQDARNPLNPPYPKGEVVAERAAPRFRHLANAIANLLTRFLFNVRCSDTQSGFRAFSRRAASLIDIRTNRMEVSSEILAEAVRHELRIAEVPIRTIYTPYSLSKGQSFTVGLQTAWHLLLRRWF